MAKALPPGIGIEWAGFPTKSGSQDRNPPRSTAIALLMVFLCLAALYESWAIPFSVMMDMPLGALGVVAATSLRGMPNDIYFQIGLITIIGLSAKNAILVVEFAKERFDRGASLVDAALHAVRQRPAPDPHDFDCLRPRRAPARSQQWRRLREPERHRHRNRRRRRDHDHSRLFFVPLYFVTVLRLFKVKPSKRRTTSIRQTTIRHARGCLRREEASRRAYLVIST
jgi:hypothetical protein